MRSYNEHHSIVTAIIAVAISALSCGLPAKADTVTQPAADASVSPKAKDDSLTLWGITLYGTADIGVAHLDHGAPLSATYGPGLPFVLQKFNNKDITSVAPNGLSQSKIGVSGVEPIG